MPVLLAISKESVLLAISKEPVLLAIRKEPVLLSICEYSVFLVICENSVLLVIKSLFYQQCVTILFNYQSGKTMCFFLEMREKAILLAMNSIMILPSRTELCIK